MQPKTPLFTSDSQHPPRFGHAVYLGVKPVLRGAGVVARFPLVYFMDRLNKTESAVL